MYADWIISSNGLPREGQQIEFLLDFRSVAMKGSYTHQAFRSHWAEYTVERVQSWRNLSEASDLAPPAQNLAERFLPSASFKEASQAALPAGGLAHAA